jgi:vacuolar protein sorting-associated protein VTA1
MGTWQDKTVVKLSSDDNMHMEGFALGVFAKADKQDRAGRADAYGLVPLLYFGN